MSTPYWTIRRSVIADTDRIMHLVRAVHGERYPEINEYYWRWRYCNDAGFPGTVFVAEHADEPIGVRPVAIYDYVWGESRLKGAMYTGVMTHPEHRRRGVFRSLVDAANRYVVDQGAAFCMTMPNDASLPGFRNSQDWKYPGVIPVYVKPVDTQRVLATRVGSTLAALAKPGVDLFFRSSSFDSADGADSCARVSRLPDDFTQAAAAFARDAETLTLERTAPYWNWRYATHPHFVYRIQLGRKDGACVGAVVTSTAEQSGIPVGLIVDLVARDGEATIRTLIHSAERDLRAQDVALITCQATTPLLCRALRAEGFRKLPDHLSPKPFNFVYRLTGAPGLPAEPRRFADWHLMFGDSDNA